jgi:glucokinase
MHKGTVIGIDLGGTSLKGALVKGNNLSCLTTQPVPAHLPSEEMLQYLISFINNLVGPAVEAIGVGVPGLVRGKMVYDVVNIPAWKEIPLQEILEKHYGLPVRVNNDANCFALGEFQFGKGREHDSMLGLTIGTGLGSGIIINKKLYEGNNGGAGEFGMMDYLDHNYEYYASGRFFEHAFGYSGDTVFEKAKKGETEALQMYHEFGRHFGNAIKAITYALDLPLIVLGGSVSAAFPYFSNAMWKEINNFGFSSIKNLKIEASQLDNSGILGAAALFS